MLKRILKVLFYTTLLILCFIVLAYFNTNKLLKWLGENDSVVTWLTTFEHSEDYISSAENAYAVAACQNSHVDWGQSVRQTLSLNGQWDIEQGAMGDEPPATFSHTVPVPGLITEATPAFTEVGIKSEQRDAFWYRLAFDVPELASEQAYLCISKVKYSAKVWLNGQPLGMHHGISSLSEYNATSALKYGQTNELLVRVGADRSQIPAFIPAGDDDEKARWYPGIWDSVSLVMTGTVTIANTKIETDIKTRQITLRTWLRNSQSQAVSGVIQHTVNESPTNKKLPQTSTAIAPTQATIDFTLQANETREIVSHIVLPESQLWTPETPFLYMANTRVQVNKQAVDDHVQRFGMRKVEWRSGDAKGFYLNDRLYYLRGTNIALHRFFGDPHRKLLPWDEIWVRRLLTENPELLHWNSFRTTIGRLPNFWYDIADEEGLIIADEYAIWSVHRGTESEFWSIVELEKEFRSWIKENWNHASIGWWDAANENNNPMSTEMIRRVRSMDVTRQWENGGYQEAVGEGDPIEEHPYKLNSGGFLNFNDKAYTLDDFSDMDGQPVQATWGPFATYDQQMDHAFINNEYAWLWLTREGNPTSLGLMGYQNIAKGYDLSPEETREAYAYVVSELSAYWRAQRGYAAIQHFVYLSECTDEKTIPLSWEVKKPSVTCDNFIDVTNLVLEPQWKKYASSAFAPVMVYLKNWHASFYQVQGKVNVPVIVLNDTYKDELVEIDIIAVASDGRVLSRSDTKKLAVSPLAKIQISIEWEAPEETEFTIFAEMRSIAGSFDTVWSRRKVGLKHPGVAIPSPPFK